MAKQRSIKKYFSIKYYRRVLSRIFHKAHELLKDKDQVKDLVNDPVKDQIMKDISYEDISKPIAIDLRKKTPHGEPTITNETLSEIIDIEKYKGKRVLEIGPKWGINSKWIDNNLRPSEFVLLDLPMTKNGLKLHGEEFHQSTWANELKSNHRFIYHNILTCNELTSIEPFDIVFCAGVLYHVIEQVKLLNILRRITKDDGVLILQSSIFKSSAEPIVYYPWFPGSLAGSAFPTIFALFKMLSMTGWTNVKHYTNYKPESNTVLLTCEKNMSLSVNAKDQTYIGGSTI